MALREGNFPKSFEKSDNILIKTRYFLNFMDIFIREYI